MPNSEETQPLLRSTDPGICDSINQGLKWRRNFQNFKCLCSSFLQKQELYPRQMGVRLMQPLLVPEEVQAVNQYPPGVL